MIEKSSVPSTQSSTFKNIVNALDLYRGSDEKRHFLLDGLIPSGSLSMLYGTSDVGKSLLARDLALHIVLGRNDYIGRKLKSDHNRVLYVSTEDDQNDIMSRIKRSICTYEHSSKLTGLDFMFPDGRDIIPEIDRYLTVNKTDLLVLDVVTDFNIGNINDATDVRRFLNKFKIMAKKTGTTVLVLHHIGKGKEGINKDLAIGSQAWTAAPRSAMMLSKSAPCGEETRLLTLTKGNFASDGEKKRSIPLQLNNETLSFNPIVSTSALEIFFHTTTKQKLSDNTEIVNMVLELHGQTSHLRRLQKDWKKHP